MKKPEPNHFAQTLIDRQTEAAVRLFQMGHSQGISDALDAILEMGDKIPPFVRQEIATTFERGFIDTE